MNLRIHWILLLVITVLCGGSRYNSPSRTTSKILLISFDGFRYDYLDRVDTPHFDSLVASGVTAEGLIPVFPTKTFPNHYSIVTGLYPEHSGLVGNTMYDPMWDEWYRIRDRRAVENSKWYGGEPIWNTFEKQSIRTGTMFWVGSEAPIQNIRPTYWKSYNSSVPFNARIDTVVKWLSYPDGRAIDFATLYFEHVDAAGHRYGLESAELDAAIEESDRLIGYLKRELRQAGLWNNLNLIIVSDHGMIQQSADKITLLDEIIHLGDLEHVIWDPVTLIQPEKGRGEDVFAALKSNEKNYRIYKKENLPKRLHFDDHRRVTDLVMVADPGYTIMPKSGKAQFLRSLPGATHGYDNAVKEMQALFVARGPDFKQGLQAKAFQNIHLYELMNHLMNTDPAPNDGSLDSVQVLLKNR